MIVLFVGISLCAIYHELDILGLKPLDYFSLALFVMNSTVELNTFIIPIIIHENSLMRIDWKMKFIFGFVKQITPNVDFSEFTPQGV